jgi:site-specific recombinase XerD
MKDKEQESLERLVRDYLDWIASLPYNDSRIKGHYMVVLNDFLVFVRNKETLQKTSLPAGLSGYLSGGKKIERPLKSKGQKAPLPDLYENYLLYRKHSHEVSEDYLRQVRRFLALFHEYLQKHQIELSQLKIKHLDTFMAEFKVAKSTLSTYRHHLRGFLKYLYHEQGIIKNDLAPLLLGPRQFSKQKPPKFLRTQEVRKLFDSLSLKTPNDIRTYAMVHLAHFLGLRPVEISRITFDDISFSERILTLRERKGYNPITLPIPENTLKAIALYVLKARPKSPERHVFVNFQFPYRAMTPGNVTGYLFMIMKKAGLPASGYWLRHTYAQNLLKMGRSIYEIKEMLGHDSIESSKVYLRINTEHIRKVLFNETL